ncbi:S-layer homology domain-containing protein [Polyangium spumosum]|nr:S-layer homology domain-containing protein [Polyangium spumosum]
MHRRILGFASLIAPLAFLLGAGCIAEPGDEGALDDENPMMEDFALGDFDRHAIIPDAEMLDPQAFTAAEVDAFLKKPYPHLHSSGSCLSRMTFGGKTAGTVIAETSVKYGLNPLFVLTHLQKESSLIGNTSATCPKSRLDKAFGCGCPDNAPCNPAYVGFDKQLDCAGKLTRGYLDDLAAGSTTIAGWKVGAGKKTLDGYTITPKGKAAAVLYTYTPWVGDKASGGNNPPFGNYLFWKVWGGYAKTLGYDGPGPVCDAVFVDVCGSTHRTAIEWLAEAGLTKGCDATKKLFCPDANVTRGQMADFLARALQLPPGPDKFTDDDGSIFEASINAVAAAGITSGCSADGTRFCPSDDITRGQMAAFLTKAFALPASSVDAFVDDETSQFEGAINALAAAGITSGCDVAKQLYCPDAKVTRAQMATFLYRSMQ